jgi:hypothetical protein
VTNLAALKVQAEAPKKRNASQLDKQRKAIDVLCTADTEKATTFSVDWPKVEPEIPPAPEKYPRSVSTGTNGKAVLLEPEFTELAAELEALQATISEAELRKVEIANLFRKAIGKNLYGVLADRSAAFARSLVHVPASVRAGYTFKQFAKVDVPEVLVVK